MILSYEIRLHAAWSIVGRPKAFPTTVYKEKRENLSGVASPPPLVQHQQEGKASSYLEKLITSDLDLRDLNPSLLYNGRLDRMLINRSIPSSGKYNKDITTSRGEVPVQSPNRGAKKTRTLHL